MPPLVSILITVYNREEYLKNALDSVLKSNFHDYEIIIVDDCSTDSSISLIEPYLKNKKIKLFQNQKNLGQFENRNFAASLATGKYIKYLDSDDMIYSYGLKAMVDFIEEFPDAGAAISHDKLHEDKPYPIFLSPQESYRAFYFNQGFPCSGPSAAIINRQIFNKIGGFPKPYYVGTDILLWLKIAAISGILKIPPSLKWYRTHEGQELNKGKTSYEYLKNDFLFLLKYLESASCPLSVSEKNAAKSILQKNHLKKILRLGIIEKRPQLAHNILKTSGLKLKDFFK